MCNETRGGDKPKGKGFTNVRANIIGIGGRSRIPKSSFSNSH